MTLPSSGPLALTDIQTEFGGSNPIGMNEYYAGGGLVPAGTSGTYGAVPSSGALSVQNFYGTSNYIPVYVEELFSTYLYTGNDSAQSVPNGINLTGNGGLVWAKARDQAYPHNLFDTARSSGGVEPLLSSNTTNGQNNSYDAASFGSSGFSYTYGNALNVSGVNYVSWTFRKQPKFFDIVTYTGTGAAGNVISHNLGSIPGCIIIKATSTTSNWFTWHIGSGISTSVFGFELNTTNPAQLPSYNGSSYFTSTTFLANAVFDSSISEPNQTGVTYVAYLFANNAGGFGLTGSDNVITCGKYDAISGGSPVVTLGFEPQWIMIKSLGNQGDYGNWGIWDSMRGLTVRSGSGSGFDPLLDANRATQEGTTYTESGDYISPTATGFIVNPTATNWSINNSGSGNSYIYIAIRRGLMKAPTVGTSVFAPTLSASYGPTTFVSTGFPVDLTIGRERLPADSTSVFDRLREASLTYPPRYLLTNSTAAEGTTSAGYGVGMTTSNTGFINNWWSGSVQWNFRRAPSFFDEVCYTGNGGTPTTFNHNLTVAPELMIIKQRNDSTFSWIVYAAPLGATKFLSLNTFNGANTSTSIWNDTAPTSSVFTVGTSAAVNSAGTYVAYLFATCPNVSKVGSYAGTGATQTISCGFTGGARFVLVKRTDTDFYSWFVWDTARGMVSGTDPSLLLNSTAAEVNANSIYTATGGFQIVSTDAGINASGGTYIFLAIA